MPVAVLFFLIRTFRTQYLDQWTLLLFIFKHLTGWTLSKELPRIRLVRSFDVLMKSDLSLETSSIEDSLFTAVELNNWPREPTNRHSPWQETPMILSWSVLNARTFLLFIFKHCWNECLMIFLKHEWRECVFLSSLPYGCYTPLNASGIALLPNSYVQNPVFTRTGPMDVVAVYF